MRHIDDIVLSFLETHKCTKSREIINGFKTRLEASRPEAYRYCVVNDFVSWDSSTEGYYFYYFLQLRLDVLVIYLYFERGYPSIVKELLNNFKDHYDLSRNYYDVVDKGIRSVGEKRFKMLHSIYNRKVKMIKDKI